MSIGIRDKYSTTYCIKLDVVVVGTDIQDDLLVDHPVYIGIIEVNVIFCTKSGTVAVGNIGTPLAGSYRITEILTAVLGYTHTIKDESAVITAGDTGLDVEYDNSRRILDDAKTFGVCHYPGKI